MAPSAPDMRVLSCLFLTKTSKLVPAALELFAQSGYLGTSMSDIAKQLGLDSGFRVVNNCGPDGGQTIPHLHFHLLAGEKLPEKLA